MQEAVGKIVVFGVFGSINMDLVARVKTIARPGETVLSRRSEGFFVGEGANQAVAAACIGRGGSGRVAMRDDPFRKACRENLQENRIDLQAVPISKEPTGRAFIAVDGSGENAITVASDANLAASYACLAAGAQEGMPLRAVLEHALGG
jgi:ribokinase